MITSDKKLRVFESFIVDPNLKKRIKKTNENESDIPEEDGNVVNGNSISFITTNISSTDPNGIIFSENARVVDYMRYVYSQNRTLINWFKLKFTERFMGNKLTSKDIVKFQSIEDFFTDIHNAVQELNLDDKSVEFYRETVKSAIDNGQQALAEILALKKNVLLKELALVKARKLAGGVKFVDEVDVVNFFEKTKDSGRYLKLTWIKNYVRVIPSDVVDTKKIYDELQIFDNYLVLHFDQKNDSAQMTHKEKEKAKDPILFGAIKDSRKLYYIGDWVDEYCDLTLDKFLKTLEQKKAKEMTNASIKKEVINQK